MVLPESRTVHSYGRRRRKRGRLVLVFALVAVLVLASVAVLRRETVAGWFASDADPAEPSLEELWKGQRYAEVRDRSTAVLDESPLDAAALLFYGFSSFYLSTEAYTLEEKLPYINDSIGALRKALLVVDDAQEPALAYVLGKAYYFKGRYYSDLAALYLERSVEAGYVADDTYEYLGLIYSNMGNYDRSAEYFKLAVEQEGTDLRYLALSQAYVNAGRTEEAESYLLRTINKTDDPMIEERSRFLLGKIYLELDQLTKAEDQYRSIVEANPRSADAHYYLGEIMLKYGKPIEARAEWREALIVDPNHYGARLRYYK